MDLIFQFLLCLFFLLLSFVCCFYVVSQRLDLCFAEGYLFQIERYVDDQFFAFTRDIVFSFPGIQPPPSLFSEILSFSFFLTPWCLLRRRILDQAVKSVATSLTTPTRTARVSHILNILVVFFHGLGRQKRQCIAISYGLWHSVDECS
jgi:hypothetical protein